MDHLVYLDHNATTPIENRVLEAMRPFFEGQFGNAASRNHQPGQVAAEAVERAREQVARLIGAITKEVIWTSGATEANNLALFGTVMPRLPGEIHVITQTTEHPAVIDPCRELERRGAAVTWLDVDPQGRIDPDAVRQALRPQTAIVSIMAANNETGTVQPIREIGAICREAGVWFHTDAAQAVGKIPIDVDADHIDLLSVSAHKMYGPKGVGALYVRSKNPRVKLHPIIFGGGHERGIRSGTINVPGAVGLGAACDIAKGAIAKDSERLCALRDRLERGIRDGVPDVHVNGCIDNRLPHVSNVRFEGVEAESMLMMLEGVAASTGSACSTMKMEPSHVLLAMGLSEAEAFECVRFSLGRSTSESQIEQVIGRIAEVADQLRSLNLAD